MVNMPEVTSYFKEVARSIKFQVAAAITFGVALIFVWMRATTFEITLTILFLFPFCMLMGSIAEKLLNWHNDKKDARMIECIKNLAH